MVIAIKSEIDSRVIVYPLLKALHNYGSVCLMSTHPQVKRLIDDDNEGGFRNIQIMVDTEGSADEMLEQYGVNTETDFDYIILDNVGATDYDVCLIPLGYQHSEIFDEDIGILLGSETANAFAIQFGKSAKSVEKNKKPDKKSKAVDVQEVTDDYDPATKFHVTVEDRKGKKTLPQSVPFPSYQEIEDLEGERKFTPVNNTLTDIFYEIFGKSLHIDKGQFRKEVQSPDESSGYIKGRNNFRG